MARLLVLGAGGYGRTVAEAAAGLFEEIAFLDDRAAAALGPCVDYEKWKGIYQYAYPAFGNNELRRKWLDVLEQAGFQLPVIVHPRAWVSPSAVSDQSLLRIIKKIKMSEISAKIYSFALYYK